MLSTIFPYKSLLQDLGNVLRDSWYGPLVEHCFPDNPALLLMLGSEAEVLLSDRIAELCPDIAPLVHCLLLEEPTLPEALEAYLSVPMLSALVEMGFFVEVDGCLKPDFYRIIPWNGLMLVAQPMLIRTDLEGMPKHRTPSVYLGQDSWLLCQHLGRFPMHSGKALDLGTGTGVLALTLAQTQQMQVLAIEMDPEAAAVAEANIFLNNQDTLVQVRQSSWQELPKQPTADRIVCNPPYIPSNAALAYPLWGNGGADGLESVRMIIEHSKTWLHPHGMLDLGLKVYGSGSESQFEKLVRQKIGRTNPSSKSKLFLTEPKFLTAPDFRSLASAVLQTGRLAPESEQTRISQELATYWRSISIEWESWAILHWHPQEQGYGKIRLGSRLNPSTILALKPWVQLRHLDGGLSYLADRQGRKLTDVLRSEVRFFESLGTQTIHEVSLSTGLSVERCLALARLYLRAGLLVENQKL